MLDKQNTKIINKLDKLCEGGAYKVFDFSQLSKETGTKIDTLKNDLQFLKENEYIDIKYSDESVVCLSVLSKGRQVKEQIKAPRYALSGIMKMMLMTGIFSGIMAFIGAFIAVLIIK